MIPTPTLDALGVTVSTDDVSEQTARAAYAWSSWSPEKRAEQEKTAYVQHIEGVAANFAALLAKHPESGHDAAWLAGQIERYRTGYLGHLLTLLASKSRVASAAVTGPSGFNHRRNDKAIASEDKRREELLSWSSRACSAIHNAICPRAISSDDERAVAKLTAERDKLAQSLDAMKAANVIVRKKISDAAKIAALVTMGFSERTAAELLKPDFAGRVGFASYKLTNGRANLKRIEDRIASLQKEAATPRKEVRCDAHGMTAVDEPDENRIMLRFDQRCDAETYAKLRAHGFVWSRTNEAWQRQRTDATRNAVKYLFGIDLFPANESAAPATRDLPPDADPEDPALADFAAE